MCVLQPAILSVVAGFEIGSSCVSVNNSLKIGCASKL